MKWRVHLPLDFSLFMCEIHPTTMSVKREQLFFHFAYFYKVRQARSIVLIHCKCGDANYIKLSRGAHKQNSRRMTCSPISQLSWAKYIPSLSQSRENSWISILHNFYKVKQIRSIVLGYWKCNVVLWWVAYITPLKVYGWQSVVYRPFAQMCIAQLALLIDVHRDWSCISHWIQCKSGGRVLARTLGTIH